VVDDGANQGAQIGPMQNPMQYEKVCGFLDDAHARGTVLAGGAPLDRDGYFIAPTIVKDIPDDAILVREEQFGPVWPVLKYDDIDDAKRAPMTVNTALAEQSGPMTWIVASRLRCGSIPAPCG